MTIAIYTTHTHTLFGEGREDSNLYQIGGNFSLAPLGQMPVGKFIPNLKGVLCVSITVVIYLLREFYYNKTINIINI